MVRRLRQPRGSPLGVSVVSTVNGSVFNKVLLPLKSFYNKLLYF